MKLNKIFASALAITLTFGHIAPTFASNIIVDTPEETNSLTMDEAEVYKQQIRSMRDEVNSLNITDDQDKEMVDEFNSKTLEIEDNIEKSSQGFSAADLYDPASIPQRLLVLGRVGRAIRFATTQLRYKVDDAHAEIAEYVFEGLVIAASPFHTVEDMKAYMAKFEVLKAKLLSYPEMGLNDTANMYVRSDLDVKLHKARFMKYNELKNKPTYVIKELDKEVAEITNGRLRPQATVLEIYQLSDRLDQAVAVALSNEDERAMPNEIDKLKELLADKKKKKRRGDSRPEVAEAIDRAKEELGYIRPSKMNVNGLIQTMEALKY
ncbi:MAG: CAMP factor family pore-forming toxin [Anaerococcus sp.]|uniref:CAMP factor family pore-forming toxin n=1 Tax=Anaerococcus sp. TaxID=1872515 RepID=UPI0028FF4F3E|nr:CAMP factor family pore-forming toxin [Anaerococcus sp.]MDU2353521.1 CAMP factor family pore-forming toxin [Anaerococcus sp.]